VKLLIVVICGYVDFYIDPKDARILMMLII
jgi:hypothetical protein